MPIPLRRIGLVAVVAGLAAANLAMVAGPSFQSTVWWKNYRWNKSRIEILMKVSAAARTPAVRAVNVWNQTDLTLPSSTSHTDISLMDGDYGNNGWRGLATVSASSTGRLSHCHAQLNRYYTSVPPGKTLEWRWEGTYSMELGHCFGLGHDFGIGSMNGAAMSSGLANRPSSANIVSINGRY